MRCKCGSYAINPELHGRKEGVDLDLCDVCYWKIRFDKLSKTVVDFLTHSGRKVGATESNRLRDKVISALQYGGKV